MYSLDVGLEILPEMSYFVSSLHSRSGRGKPTGLKLLNFTWERKTSHAANFSARRVFLLHRDFKIRDATAVRRDRK